MHTCIHAYIHAKWVDLEAKTSTVHSYTVHAYMIWRSRLIRFIQHCTEFTDRTGHKLT